MTQNIDRRRNVERRKTVDFQGAIDVVTIEGIFQLLYYANLSGKLLLLDPPKKASFYFSNGKLMWGSLHSEQKQLGQRLIDSSAITQEQLKECLVIHIGEKHKKRLGKILLEKGFLQTDILHESLKQQAREAFFSALTWRQGSFAFISDAPSEEDEFTLNERIDHLLLEGVLQIDRDTTDSSLYQ